MTPLESYLTLLRDIRSTGAAVAETSFYPALSSLFNEIGKGLRPKVRCVMPIADRGAGLPDGGFFAATQFCAPLTSQPKLANVSIMSYSCRLSLFVGQMVTLRACCSTELIRDWLASIHLAA